MTDCCSHGGNCLIYGMPCGDLTLMFPPTNLLFVQSPSACTPDLARVNNSAALTDAKLLLDVFERLPSDLVLMSVIQSMITFFSKSSVSLLSPSVDDLSNLYKSSSPESPALYGLFAVNRKFDISVVLAKLKESRKEYKIVGLISLLYLGDSILTSCSRVL